MSDTILILVPLFIFTWLIVSSYVDQRRMDELSDRIERLERSLREEIHE